MLSELQTKELQNDLFEQHQLCRRRIEYLRRESFDATFKETIGDVSSYDNHPADQGSETYERSKDLGALREGLDELRAIESALQRIDAGTYGRCESCGKEMNFERLKARPTARKCVTCAR